MRRPVASSLLLFLAVLIVYPSNGRTIGAGDPLPATYLRWSLLQQKNLDLDEFRALYDVGTQSPSVMRSLAIHSPTARSRGPRSEHRLFFVVAVVFLMSAIGYGSLLSRWCFAGHRIDAAFAAAVGIAILVFVGGILNALGLAFGSLIDALLSAGVISFVAQNARTVVHPDQRARLVAQCRRDSLEPGLWLAAAVFVFSAIWVVPTTRFNPHDDLIQYLFRPFHMLQFGSVGANWFDSTGADSFGAQSWMQAFFLNHLSAKYADAFDAVICFSLSCALVVALGRALGVARIYRLIAVLVLVFANPSQVNISAIYSLTTTILGLTLSLLLFARSYFDQAKTRTWTRALIPSVLFVATLSALKFTTLFFVAGVCLMLTLAAIITFRTWRDVGIAVLVALALGTIAIVPWTLIFVPQYMASLSAPPPDPNWTLTWQQILRESWLVHSRLWLQVDPDPGQYGQRALVSTCAVLGVLIAPIILVGLRANRGKSTIAETFTCTVVGPSAVVLYLIGPGLVPWSYLRYSAPFLISAFPAAILFVLSATSATYKTASGYRSFARTVLAGAVLAASAIVITLTAEDLVWRLNSAVHGRTDPREARRDVADLLSADYKQRIRAIQNKIPPGKKILAAIITPTQLDLERNPTDALFMAGLSSPWWGELAGDRPEEVRALLLKRGIEYVIWQPTGAWVVPPETAALDVDHRRAVFRRSSRNYLAIYRAFEGHKMGPLVHKGDLLAFKLEADLNYAGQASLYSYQLGTTIDFAAGGDFNHGVSGWSYREPTGMWSIDKTAQLLFQLEQPPCWDLTLVAQFAAFVVPQHPKTSVDVEVNGTPVGHWALTSTVPTTQRVHVPREVAGDGELKVTFRIDAPPSPATLGLSKDTRNLGILLKEVTINPNPN
jgi:hypothetical protein